MAIARKLRDLATDAVQIPDTKTVYARKVSELDDARRKYDGIIQRQIEAEKLQPSQRSTSLSGILAARADAEALIKRLEGESSVVRAQLDAENPKPILTPAQQRQALADGLRRWNPYANVKRGSPEKIAAAREELAALAREEKLTQTSRALSDKMNAVRTRVMALEGPPFPAWRPWCTDEALLAARKKEGLA